MLGSDSNLHCRVMSLFSTELAMVLCTLDVIKAVPWTATVYFLYDSGLFYFLSSPKSRHVCEGIKSDVLAVSIFSPAKSLANIKGVQMIGNISKVKSFVLRKNIIKQYFSKFSFAKDLLLSDQKEHITRRTFLEKSSVKLYSFSPSKVLYTDNNFGFSFRKEINLV